MKDNKKIINEFKAYVDSFIECCTTDHEVHELLKAVDKVIEEQEERIAIMGEGGWHKITDSPDSLPKDLCHADIWICCKDENGNREVFKAIYYSHHFYDCGGWLYTEGCGWKITHWMYRRFPEPPKDGE